jgi:hypothetical protein
MKHATLIVTALVAAAILAGSICHAASPPTLVNYQGVLRDAADRPLDGDHDMVFRFFSAEIGGDEILIDLHTTVDSVPVTVTGGLFGVQLGAGAVQDGSGPGTHTSLATVFRDYTDVWLEVQIGGELLAPRVQVVAAAYALNAKNLDGRSAAGFINTTSQWQTKVGQLTINSSAPGAFGLDVYATDGAYVENVDGSSLVHLSFAGWGVRGRGNQGGGWFRDLNQSGLAYVGFEDLGIDASGNEAGGRFWDLDGSGYARVAVADTGIEAWGRQAGGYFRDDDLTAEAYVARGNTGIEATGQWYGGHFRSADDAAQTYVASGDTGIEAYGDWRGAYFQTMDYSSHASVGIVGWGVQAAGNIAGGKFENLIGGSYADLGREDYGIRAYGNVAGGTFHDRDQSGYAYIANGNWGIGGYGDNGGGYFEDTNGSGVARVGYSTYKIQGTGAVSFVQNHPEQSDRVIVYAAPEGDEVATYTRGTARLTGGVATVALGETFGWVTNPDIGLTAHITPRGACRGLYVESLTTSEMVVRELDGGGGDVVFDYLVYGLRIGFEETSVVQEKTVEGMIPSMAEHRDLYERYPELRGFNALERFEGMVTDVEGIDTVDLSRAAALRAKIQEYDAGTHGPVQQLLGHGPPTSERETEPDPPAALEKNDTVEADTDLDAPALSPETTATLVETRGEPLPAAESVESGQVLAFDPERPGAVRAASTMADPRVIGVAVGVEGDPLVARVVMTGPVECRVDAGYGAIRSGDLLTSSPTTGYAMRAIDVPPGTILGKALEPLETGTGTIRILVMPR